VNESGNFNLKLSNTSLGKVKIFIAPANKNNKVPSLKELEKINAYQPFLDKKIRRNEVVELLPVPERIYELWWSCSCRVTGRVTKKVSIGGAWQIMPVCKARVHICEVDRWHLIL